MTADRRAALKLNIDEAKFLEAVDREGDHEIGVGSAMTTDRRAALVERVANRMGEAISLWLHEHPGCVLEDVDTAYVATAAIDLIRAEVLEEAAGVVTEHYQELCTEHRLLLVNRAAAIRALKVTPSTT